jgi:hypothetical protein
VRDSISGAVRVVFVGFRFDVYQATGELMDCLSCLCLECRRVKREAKKETSMAFRAKAATAGGSAQGSISVFRYSN